MIKSPFLIAISLSALTMAGALAVLGPSQAAAQSATKLKCKGCVSSKQIKNKGIKAADLKDNVVDSTKVRNESLTGADVANGSLTSADVQDGSLTSADLQDGSLSAADLAANAVGTEEIQGGAVTMAKLAPDAVFGRVLVVGADPADPGGNCDALQAALAGTTDNDASNRYLLYLEPGIYDCGTVFVQMKPFIDLQGSGQGVTEITGNSVGVFGVVNMVADTELSDLTVTNLGGTSEISLAGTGTNLRVSDVTARAFDGTSNSIGLFLTSCEATLTNVTAIGQSPANPAGSHRGVDFSCDSVTAVNLVAEGDHIGLRKSGAGTEVLIRNSVIEGGTQSVLVQDGLVNLAHSQLIGPVVGTTLCIGNYDASILPVGC